MIDQTPSFESSKLALPQVTLCAATSVNLKATICALEESLAQVDFASCKLFTDAQIEPEHNQISIVPIPTIDSSRAYSDFLLSRMVDYIDTPHCLVVQWDGHVIDAKRWRPDFLDFDYIGASWPQFDDGHNVGNGGFSLRSRALMEACRDPSFKSFHPEDVAICRINKLWLEERGMRFASTAIADQFAAERGADVRQSFGYHGVFNIPRAIGVEKFWRIYKELDDRSTIKEDFWTILRDIWCGPGGAKRVKIMIADRLNGRMR